MCKVLYIGKPNGFGIALTAQMQAYGHNVMRCSLLSKGRELFQQAEPDVVICEIDIEDGNGLKFLYRLKRQASKFRAFKTILSVEDLTDWELDDIYDCSVDEVITFSCDDQLLAAFRSLETC